jgi:sec-independent protein translocase protein TatB
LPEAGSRATVPGQVFGISFTELVLILVVALVVLGPQRLPGMLRTVGLWIHKLRRMTTEVREQTGIDDLMRQEGFSGGISELRSLLRGDPRSLIIPPEAGRPVALDDPYGTGPTCDRSREQPVEGPDAQGAIPDDLVDVAALPATGQAELRKQPDERT